ncbi:hypothetical protein P9112_009018 [Eukaryota sp. TZLM1-RC]
MIDTLHPLVLLNLGIDPPTIAYFVPVLRSEENRKRVASLLSTFLKLFLNAIFSLSLDSLLITKEDNYALLKMSLKLLVRYIVFQPLEESLPTPNALM